MQDVTFFSLNFNVETEE
jgi:hypothetical protein